MAIKDKTVGIVGFGTIGRVVGKVLDDGMPGLTLTHVTGRDQKKAAAAMSGFQNPVHVVELKELVEAVDVVVECAPTAAFGDIANATIDAGATMVTVSAAAILDHPDIIKKAAARGTQIILATGALLGLDAVRAAAEGTVHKVEMVTRKPPPSLAKAQYLIDNGIDVMGLTEPLKLFEGTAREGAQKFPANVNVAAALGLAGVGPDKTKLEIWADPGVTYNTHNIFVDSDSARLSMKIENIPTEENPGTGRITALSVLATLRALSAPLRAGT